jgi:transglutaminase-like putative cysteine protease
VTTSADVAPPVAPGAPERPPAPGDGPPSRRGDGPLSRRRPTLEPALLVCLVALTLADVVAFHRVFSDNTWVAPVLIVALGAHVVAALLRRTRLPPLAAMAGCLVAVVVLGLCSVHHLTTRHGLPDLTTLRSAVDDLRRARADLPTAVAPVPALPGFTLLAAWAVGVVAVLGDWGTFRLRSAVQGLAPALALFVVCGVLAGPDGGSRAGTRTVTAALWVSAAVAFGLVHRVTRASPRAGWFGGRSAGAMTPTLRRGVVIGAAAVVAVVAVSPLLPVRDGRGLLGWHRGPGGNGTRSVESPIVDLRTRIVTERRTPVFTVRSPVPSYWQLTTLDRFTGTLWESTDSYQSVHDRLPGVGPVAPGTPSVVEDVHIQDLDSVWLPAAFDPEAVRGAPGVTYDPVSASLIGSRATSNGLAYQVTSLERLAGLSAATLAAAPPATAVAGLAPDLQLPRSIPPAVVALARRITAGASTEYAKALAIQDWLRGPSFTYSTDPPTDGYGLSALTTFLLDTRTGYCQQFAGSYAVLARIVGVPTRLAVGFATGTRDRSGTFHVTDADAHTWPEVFFTGVGWVPFEPTKGNGFAIPGGDAYTGSTLGGSATAPTPGPAPRAGAQTTPTTAVGRTGPDPQPVPVVATADAGNRAAGLTLPATVVAAIVAAVAVWVTANVGIRRWRRARRRRRTGTTAVAVIEAWEQIGERLASLGLPRRPEETPAEYARRASAVLAPDQDADDDGSSDPSAALVVLGDQVARVSYGRHEPEPTVVARLLADASRLDRILRGRLPRRALVRQLFDGRHLS